MADATPLECVLAALRLHVIRHVVAASTMTQEEAAQMVDEGLATPPVALATPVQPVLGKGSRSWVVEAKLRTGVVVARKFTPLRLASVEADDDKCPSGQVALAIMTVQGGRPEDPGLPGHVGAHVMEPAEAAALAPLEVAAGIMAARADAVAIIDMEPLRGGSLAAWIAAATVLLRPDVPAGWAAAVRGQPYGTYAVHAPHACAIGLQVLQATQYLHGSLQALSGDIRPAGVLLRSPAADGEAPVVALANLAAIKAWDGNGAVEGHRTRWTEEYTPPVPRGVALQDGGVGRGAGDDVYSVGCVLAELVVGSGAFQTHVVPAPQDATTPIPAVRALLALVGATAPDRAHRLLLDRGCSLTLEEFQGELYAAACQHVAEAAGVAHGDAASEAAFADVTAALHGLARADGGRDGGSGAGGLLALFVTAARCMAPGATAAGVLAEAWGALAAFATALPEEEAWAAVRVGAPHPINVDHLRHVLRVAPHLEAAMRGLEQPGTPWAQLLPPPGFATTPTVPALGDDELAAGTAGGGGGLGSGCGPEEEEPEGGALGECLPGWALSPRGERVAAVWGTAFGEAVALFHQPPPEPSTGAAARPDATLAPGSSSGGGTSGASPGCSSAACGAKAGAPACDPVGCGAAGDLHTSAGSAQVDGQGRRHGGRVRRAMRKVVRAAAAMFSCLCGPAQDAVRV